MEGGGGGGGGQGEQGHHAEEPQGRHTQGRRENSYMYTHVYLHVGFHWGGGGGGGGHLPLLLVWPPLGIWLPKNIFS